MCTILDNDVVAAVFRPDPCPGAREFKRWIEAGGARLVVGGKNLRELCKNRAFRAWLQEALRQGKATSVPDSRVDKEAESLRQSASFKSNDEHVLALARLSGARLLYSRDGPLGDDFKGRTSARGASWQGLPGEEGRRVPALAAESAEPVRELKRASAKASLARNSALLKPQPRKLGDCQGLNSTHTPSLSPLARSLIDLREQPGGGLPAPGL